MQNVKISNLPNYKNFGNKIEKNKQIDKSSCTLYRSMYNEEQEKTKRTC